MHCKLRLSRPSTASKSPSSSMRIPAPADTFGGCGSVLSRPTQVSIVEKGKGKPCCKDSASACWPSHRSLRLPLWLRLKGLTQRLLTRRSPRSRTLKLPRPSRALPRMLPLGRRRRALCPLMSRPRPRGVLKPARRLPHRNPQHPPMTGTSRCTATFARHVARHQHAHEPGHARWSRQATGLLRPESNGRLELLQLCVHATAGTRLG